MPRPNRFVVLLCALSACCIRMAGATDGYYDTTWYNSGRFPFGGSNQEAGNGARMILAQPDGTLLLAGMGFPWWLAQMSVEGQFDSSFGSNSGTGFVSGCELGTSCDQNKFVTLLRQPDGKIVVLQTDQVVARTGPGAHALDTAGTYSGTGLGFAGWKFTDHSGFLALATSMARQYDGKILVAGSGRAADSAGTDSFAVIRLNEDLSLDTSFGAHSDSGVTFAGGNAFFVDGADLVERVTSVISLADGFLLLVGVGSHNADGSAATLEFARLNPVTGLLDTNFGNAGVSKGFYSGTLSTTHPVAARSDGQLRTTIATTSADAANLVVARFTGMGPADATFGSAGFTAIAACPQNVARDLVFDTAGRVLVAGGCVDAQLAQWFSVVRVRGDNGSLDQGFGINGVSLGVFDETGHGAAGFGIALDRSGHPLVTGDSDPVLFPYYQGVARLTYDLTYASGFEMPPGCLPPDCL